MGVVDGVEAVRQRVARAVADSGRAPGSVRLLAVSKLKPAAAVREAYALGQRDFGENYVQELVAKAAELSELGGLRWHLIGHLQRNKARHVAEVASAVQSVDSLELVAELGKRVALAEARRVELLGAEGRQLDVLVEVSIAGEAQKSGVPPAELGAVLAAIEARAELRLRGLMCVPPAADDPALSRPYFERLRLLRDEHGGRERLPELSMGMTADLEQAIAAGATWVRVGSAIFGERQPRAAG
jgi:pyridoxal phosphate enzyme (YggS family)